MTQSLEALAIMDDNRQATVTFGKPRGYLVSGWMAALYGILLVGGIVATGLLVYHFATCHSNAFMEDSTQSHLTNETAENVLRAALPETKMGKHSTDSKKKLDVRLPRSIVPDSYKISIIPFIRENNFTFHGEVRIVLNVTEDTTNITLHINDIKVDESSVSVLDLSYIKDKYVITKQSNNSARQFLILDLDRPLMKGKQYEVYIKYIGNLNDILQGFYRSSYTVANQTRWIAVTQFQPTDARRAFPCFDEPALKAKFTISIARPKSMISISNMPRDGDSTKTVVGLPDYVWDNYVQSVPMSTYLVAWVVSDFEQIQEGRFAVWAREEAISQARYALDIGPKILTYFEQYFNIKFPLPKMDMIALPDFAAGAMENWGLITYRETAMLYTPGVSTNSNKQSVATVISHELAHQWFGNLVTPSWWTDLWLNEGFASYVEYLGVDAVEPSWKILEQFVIYDLQNVLSLDALKSSHRISIEVGHPDEINEIFDRISYGKGASIIRMMDHFLTTDVFKRGITNYLNSRAYGSSTQNDLWAALTAQAHQDNVLDKNFTVKTIMDTWTLQTGFPVLTVTRDYGSGSILLTQERFLLHKESHTKSTNDMWWIPVSFTTAEQPDFVTTKPSQWLQATPSLALQDFKAGSDHWVVFNIQQTGFYRVNYDARNWEMLIKHLEDASRFKQISTINRAQLIDDAMNLARGERLPYTTALSTTRYLKHEEEFLPWKAALIAFGYIDSMLVRTGNYETFQMYVLSLISNLYSTVGFTDNKDDGQLTVYKRVNALNWACSLGHEDCVNQCIKQFQSWRSSPDPDNNNPISANLKNVVYCTAVRVGGQAEWDFAWERYKKTNVGSEKDLLLGALGCSRETWILSRYLDWAISDKSGIRKQDAARVFASVANNVIGQSLAYNFLRDQWDRIRNYLGSSLFTINNIVRATTKRINTQYELDDLLRFAELHLSELGTATRAVDQAIEQAQANVKWMKRNGQIITEWLTNTTSSLKTSIS